MELELELELDGWGGEPVKIVMEERNVWRQGLKTLGEK